MSRRKRTNAASARPAEASHSAPGRAPRDAVGSAGAELAHHPANPPKRRRGLLIVASALLTLWLAALLTMAVLYGSFRPGN